MIINIQTIEWVPSSARKMMIRSLILRPSSSSSSAFLPKDVRKAVVLGPRSASTVCCSSRSDAYIPKLEPFSRTKFDRVVKDPPLIQKSENDLADYCSTLEGDDSYSCWRAYFELKDLEKESPKAEVEKLILQSGGVKSLVGFLHGVAAIHKAKKGAVGPPNEAAVKAAEQGLRRTCPVPDGLPKTAEEIEEEDKARMPDSSYTRLLRTKGRFPAWYSRAPDHETD